MLKIYTNLQCSCWYSNWNIVQGNVDVSTAIWNQGEFFFVQGRFARSDVMADVFMYRCVHVSVFHEIYRQILVHSTFLWCYRQTEEKFYGDF